MAVQNGFGALKDTMIGGASYQAPPTAKGGTGVTAAQYQALVSDMNGRIERAAQYHAAQDAAGAAALLSARRSVLPQTGVRSGVADAIMYVGGSGRGSRAETPARREHGGRSGSFGREHGGRSGMIGYTADNIGDYRDRAIELAAKDTLTDGEKAEARELQQAMESWIRRENSLMKQFTGERDIQTINDYSALAQALFAKSSALRAAGTGFLSAVPFAQKVVNNAQADAAEFYSEDIRPVMERDLFADARAASPIAYAAGDLAGELLMLLAAGELVGGATAGLAKAAEGTKYAKYALQALRSGTTFAVKSGLQSAGRQDWSDVGTAVKNTAKEAGIAAAEGAVGGAAAGAVDLAFAKVLTARPELMTPLWDYVKNTTRTLTFGTAATETGYALRGEKPTREQRALDYTINTAFAAILGGAETLTSSEAAEQQLRQEAEELARDMRIIADAENYYVSDVYEAAERAAARIDRISTTYYAGQGETLKNSRDALQFMKELCKGTQNAIEEMTAGTYDMPGLLHGAVGTAGESTALAAARGMQPGISGAPEGGGAVLADGVQNEWPLDADELVPSVLRDSVRHLASTAFDGNAMYQSDPSLGERWTEDWLLKKYGEAELEALSREAAERLALLSGYEREAARPRIIAETFDPLVEHLLVESESDVQTDYSDDEKDETVRRKTERDNLTKLLQSDKLPIKTLTLEHSVIGSFNKAGVLTGGCHSETGIIELQRRGIEYVIDGEFTNGVRLGHIPEHKTKYKRQPLKQAWFPADWDEQKILEAGISVAMGESPLIDGYKKIGAYDGVMVRILLSPEGEITTICPDYDQDALEGAEFIEK